MRKVVIEIETTGENLLKDRIISLSALEIDEDCRLTGNVFVTLVNPQRSIPREATIATDISQASVKSSPAMEDIKESLLSFIGDKEIVTFSRTSLEFLEQELDVKFLKTKSILAWAEKLFPYQENDFFSLKDMFRIRNLDTLMLMRPLSKCYIVAQIYQGIMRKVGEYA